MRTLEDIKLIQTCSACPEQYDALIDDMEIGYLRLRHGYFRAEYKGDIVYEASPDGDGCFTSDERDFYLTMAKQAILLKYNEEHK